MRTWIQQIFVVLLAISMLILVGCEDKGPAEKAGESLDKTMEDVKEKVEEATE